MCSKTIYRRAFLAALPETRREYADERYAKDAAHVIARPRRLNRGSARFPSLTCSKRDPATEAALAIIR